tara:strand:+ start:442 stop:1245 length:804 start_codon:yes stop_codon:yes gene_type:complete
MKVIILTGTEKRHVFFRKSIANDNRIEVLNSFCENNNNNLINRVIKNKKSSFYEIQHVKARYQSEIDFFDNKNSIIVDKSNPIFINKGEINDEKNVLKIINKNPDLLICYGSSLIKSRLLEIFRNKFINVHLGLSPYYRGTGTNVWPLINNEPGMVGATFMHIDSGIDTGEIIHQVRADIFLGDSPHTIGNRLIIKMTQNYINLITNFKFIPKVKQPNVKGKLYQNNDFDDSACRKLYDNFNNGMIEKYLKKNEFSNPIVSNPILDL